MRYITQNSGGATAFNPGNRPPLATLPVELAEKIAERDRIMAQRAEAQSLLAELSTDVAAKEATRLDDLAAAEAARAGKTIPAPKAMPKLEKDRQAAQYAATAQEAAFVEINGELDNLASDLYWGAADDAAKVRAEACEAIRAKAEELADLVESVVHQTSTREWMRRGVFDQTVRTWPTDIVDLARYGLDRKNVTPVNVRDVIVAAALAALEEQEN